MVTIRSAAITVRTRAVQKATPCLATGNTVTLSENTTVQNCHKVLFGKTKAPQPSVINGYTRDQQPEMWP